MFNVNCNKVKFKIKKKIPMLHLRERIRKGMMWVEFVEELKRMSMKFTWENTCASDYETLK